MKPMIWTFLLVTVLTITLAFKADYRLMYREDVDLKFYAQEAAAAGAQYFDVTKYGEGQLVFNQEEAKKAIEYMIQKNLKLDSQFRPQKGSYWTDQIKYKAEFFDDSNTTFPYLYSHESTYFTQLLTDPTVVVTIDAGRPRFRLYGDPPRMLRVGAHSWEERHVR